ncbi:hypothetical protein CVT26_007392 [Gymnopilus dilepis]|uniref:Uncharacterized protein n=1 Tax=Gymnopilus dilepis TaxID=231916 RepID=A0A409WTF6_9AGAR|nr:hypothetical protein CVT26_007392 [Gymnopilus dilepis]
MSAISNALSTTISMSLNVSFFPKEIYCNFTRANQPHALYCKDSAIIQGGYFYLTGLMAATSCGIVCDFISRRSSPDVYRRYYPRLLRSVIDFYRLGLLEHKISPLEKSYEHLPKIHTFAGLSDLLSICSLLVLANVLDMRTYSAPNQSFGATIGDSQLSLMDQFDRNDIPTKERLYMAYARGLALSTMQWVRELCEITSPDGKVILDFPFKYLIYHLVALLRFKKAAEERLSTPSEHCNLVLLRRQIENVVKCDQTLMHYWSEVGRHVDDMCFAELLRPGHSVRWRDRPQRELVTRDLLSKGITPLDVRFWKGEMARRSQDLQMIN